MDNLKWSQWPADLHQQPDQIKRQFSAAEPKHQPLQLDRETLTGIFAGSGKKPYTTTLSKCTCNDYVKRKLPCKHMYSLAHQLGYIELRAATDDYDKSMTILAAYPSTNDWGNWHPAIHKDWMQKERYERTFEVGMTVKNLLVNEQTAVINGYNVNLKECTCPDFGERKFPCKHIYRLAVEIGILEKPLDEEPKYQVSNAGTMFVIKYK